MSKCTWTMLLGIFSMALAGCGAGGGGADSAPISYSSENDVIEGGFLEAEDDYQPPGSTPAANNTQNQPANNTNNAEADTPVANANPSSAPGDQLNAGGPPQGAEWDVMPPSGDQPTQQSAPPSNPAISQAPGDQLNAGGPPTGSEWDVMPPSEDQPTQNSTPTQNPQLAQPYSDEPSSGGAQQGGFKGRGRTFNADGDTEAGINPAESDAGGNQPAAEAAPVTFMTQAAQNFKAYDENTGIQMLYAHWLLEEDAASAFPIQWVESIKEPRLFVRWGIGVELVTPSDFRSQPPVIDDQAAPAASNTQNRGRFDGDEFDGGAGATGNNRFARSNRSEPLGALLYLTGDLGERLVKRLDSRRTHSTAFYGKMLADIDLSDVEANAAASNAASASLGRGSAVSADSDDFSDLNRSNGVIKGGATSGGTQTRDAYQTGTIIPGVVFVGVEESRTGKKALMDRAQEMGLDGLIVITVDVKTRRSGPAYSVVTSTAYNVKSGESKRTSGLNNETIAEKRAKDSTTDDPVEKELDKLFPEFADTQLQLVEMPKISAEIAKQRVESLATSIPLDPLPVIAEIVNYFRQNLIDEATAAAAIEQLIDADFAKAVINGSEDDKQAALNKWLDGNKYVADEDSSFR